MKKQITTAALALALLFTAGAASAQEYNIKQTPAGQDFSMDISYSGAANAQPSFSMDFSKQDLKKPYMVIKNGDNETVYAESLTKEHLKKTYRLDMPGFNDSVTFELYDSGKKVYSKTFRFSQETEVKTRVSESK